MISIVMFTGQIDNDPQRLDDSSVTFTLRTGGGKFFIRIPDRVVLDGHVLRPGDTVQLAGIPRSRIRRGKHQVYFDVFDVAIISSQVSDFKSS